MTWGFLTFGVLSPCVTAEHVPRYPSRLGRRSSASQRQRIPPPEALANYAALTPSNEPTRYVATTAIVPKSNWRIAFLHHDFRVK